MGWDSSNDWSYQHNAEVYEPNYFMAVYDASHNILWGSDPLGGNQNTSDVLLWTDRGSNFTVERYDGDSTEVVPAGRFWLLKDTPISPKERNLLAERGIVKHSVGRHQGKTLALFRSETDVQKSLLDSLVAGFYNTVAVDDSTPVEIEFYQDSLYEDSSRIDMEIYCWPDVSVNTCVEEVAACGGDDIGVARGLLIARVRKESLQCLAQSRNIDGLVVQHELGLASSAVDRDAVNISSLQNNDTAWQAALQMDRATKEWLSGVEYTGDGIVVGVYESGFGYIHPDFNEYDSSMALIPREIRKDEFWGLDGRALSRQVNGYDAHAYGVAGIIGGNGNDSSGFKYRQPLKITPKRLFTNKLTFAVFGPVTTRGFFMDQLSFFDLNDRLEQISKIGDPLEVLNEIVDWSKFDAILLKAKAMDLTVRKVNGSAGRKPFSLRLMLKVFIRTNTWEKPFRKFDWMLEDKGLFVRTIGKARAEAKILASFLTYNMFRMVALTRPKWA